MMLAARFINILPPGPRAATESPFIPLDSVQEVGTWGQNGIQHNSHRINVSERLRTWQLDFSSSCLIGVYLKGFAKRIVITYINLKSKIYINIFNCVNHKDTIYIMFDNELLTKNVQASSCI